MSNIIFLIHGWKEIRYLAYVGLKHSSFSLPEFIFVKVFLESKNKDMIIKYNLEFRG